MNEFFVCSTRYIKLYKSNQNFDFGSFSFSNDDSLLERLLRNEFCIQSIGLINMPPCRQNSPFFYGSIENSRSREERVRDSEKDLEFFQSILANLWFIKDCSCNSSFHYDISKRDKFIFNRTRTTVFSNSLGNYGNNFFSIEDIKTSYEITKKIMEIQNISKKSEEFYKQKPNQEIGHITPGDSNYKKYANTNRIERAYLFLSMARSHSFLPLKISFYIGLLETIFTTDGSEVTHKVSERCAFYLCEFFDKQNTFDFIKECYGIRSKFVHGQKLHKKYDYETLKLKSVKLDDIMRKLMNKIVLNDSKTFLKNDADLNNFFKRLVFAGCSLNVNK
ncbi:hypothetical protein [Wenyingzhuangia sp. IMCC45574]